MDVQLLAIDLDGTLLGPDGRVPAAHRAAVHAAHAAGVEVLLATGRAWSECRAILEDLDLDGEMIGGGGALWSRSRDGETIARRAMSESVLRRAAEVLLAHGHCAHLLQDGAASPFDYIMVGEHAHDPATEWWMREHALRLDVRATLDEIKDANALSHTVRIGTVASSGSLEPVVHALQVELGDSVHAQHWPAVVESEKTGRATHLLELFSPGVDKWTMLQEVIAKRAIGPHNVVAIGDGLNDIGMVSGAGFGFAMGQGDGRLHAVADRIVGSNATGGLAEAIDAVLSGDLVRSVNCND